MLCEGFARHRVVDAGVPLILAYGQLDRRSMCKVNPKKRWPDYIRLRDTKTFIEVLEATLGIHRVGLIITNQAGDKYAQGTWVHPHIARWISPPGRPCSSMIHLGALSEPMGIPIDGFDPHTIEKHRALYLHRVLIIVHVI